MDCDLHFLSALGLKVQATLAMGAKAPAFGIIHLCQLHFLKNWRGATHQVGQVPHQECQGNHFFAARHCNQKSLDSDAEQT